MCVCVSACGHNTLSNTLKNTQTRESDQRDHSDNDVDQLVCIRITQKADETVYFFGIYCLNQFKSVGYVAPELHLNILPSPHMHIPPIFFMK